VEAAEAAPPPLAAASPDEEGTTGHEGEAVAQQPDAAA
jgi:hypothetical protein